MTSADETAPAPAAPTSKAAEPGLVELGGALAAALAEAEAFANAERTREAIARIAAREAGGADDFDDDEAEDDVEAASGALAQPTPVRGHEAVLPEVHIGPAIRGMPARDRHTVALEAQLEQLRVRLQAQTETAERATKDAELARSDLRATRQRFAKVADQLNDAQRKADRLELELPAKTSRRLLLAVLPALDAQHAVFQALQADASLAPSHAQAIAMAVAEWDRVLAGLGVSAFDALGQHFDPLVHEAISTQPADGAPAGSVVRQVGRGYLLEGRVLRTAKVVVAE